jgi:branched-chain amino acid transport system ATP-binding protein
MNPRQVAEMGVARTFQNLALFKGMSVLDNIMTGRNLKMKTNLFAAGHALGLRRSARRSRTAPSSSASSTSWRSRPPQDAGRALPYGLQKRVDLGRALAMEPSCCCSTSRWPA